VFAHRKVERSDIAYWVLC